MATTNEVKYRRIVIKLSGEVFRDLNTGDALDFVIVRDICKSLKELHQMGVEIALVVGGGNIFRGLSGSSTVGTDRTTGDHMGMLSTAINALALMDTLEKMDVKVRVQSAIAMDRVAEPFILRRAVRHLEKGRIVIFACGTGNPFFSTDTSAALRASEIGAEIIFKATKVDGVYDKDPIKYQNAVKYNQISYQEVIHKNLQIMDQTAFTLCQNNKIPIIIFNMNEKGVVKKALYGEAVGTLVSD